ncbi:phospholipase A2 [Streptosporangium sp. NPDC087985]|uniref:phospholipase A2 n=1 Tax=Streptosporangium sp. NPDC087985 TaxID=3366196 RepID=UPI00380CB12C
MRTSSAEGRSLTPSNRRRRRLGALAMATLLVPGLTTSTMWLTTTPATAEPATSAAADDLSRAAQQAAHTGKPVSLPGETTETSTSEVTPEGKLVTTIAAGPVRVKGADGTWRDIDTALVKDGDVLRPKVAKADVRFSTGGAHSFAQLTQDAGETLSLGWNSALPEPVIEGNKAIYRGVVGSTGDLVATALPTGLRFDVVLRERPAGPVEVKIPFTGKGLTVGEQGGRLQIINPAGKVVAGSSTPAMWDAGSLLHRGADGTPNRPRQHGAGRAGAITSSIEDTAGGKTLMLKPSTSFLNDPATAYPVTVDPSVILPLNGDTDVNSVFDWNNVSGEYLKAGTETNGEKARVYLKFDTRGLQATASAELKLTNIDAPKCGATVGAGIQVRRVTSWLDMTTQTWAPQPTNTTEDAVLSTEGSQLGVCGSGKMTWNITGIVAKWAAGTPNHGLVLQSPTETKTANYRVFPSAENIEEFADPPTLTVTSDIPFTPGEGDDPADPGPADFKPGQVEPETGVWVTSAIDLDTDGLLTTRSHSAGQRIDLTLPNESVLGPNWRLEPLDGLLGKRLKDFSANGYIRINHTTGTESDRYAADPANPGSFVAPETSTVTKNADGTFTQTGVDNSSTYTWTKIGTDYLITKLGSADTGMSVISYDTLYRISRLTQPTTPQDDCTVANAAGCATATYEYATTTTATSTTFADIAGQLKAISYDAAGDTAPVTAVTYAYDNLKRLRKVEDSRQLDDDPVKTWTYAYDSSGNITKLTTPTDGTWELTYSAPGKLTTATEVTTYAVSATSCPRPYASDYMLYGRCSTQVDVQPGSKIVWRSPFWKGNPTGGSVYGISNDGCSAPLIGDRPPTVPGLSFKPACDSHDYGYGLIRNKMNGMSNGLSTSQRTHVDAVFKTIMKTRICAAQNVSVYRERCNDWANIYYNAVRAKGNGAL